jgi:hypothetical protein
LEPIRKKLFSLLVRLSPIILHSRVCWLSRDSSHSQVCHGSIEARAKLTLSHRLLYVNCRNNHCSLFSRLGAQMRARLVP